MKRILTIFSASLFAMLVSACSTVAPNYTPSIANVESLKKVGDFHAKVGTFTSAAAEGNANPISLRGTNMISPYQDSYAAYVAEALRQELAMSQKLGPNADIELSGVLLTNDINPDMSIGHGNISMQLSVKKNNQVNYERVISTKHQWESSFMGAIAIPQAIQEYPIMIQKLLASLYEDKDFINAIK
jgi:hypothetical protein